jgi:hypothetical protein
MWYICVCNEMLLSHKEEWNFVVCKQMDGPGEHHVKWSKPGSE